MEVQKISDTKSPAVRNSSFELLRILCMFMIVAYHYNIHGNSSNIFQSDFSLNQLYSIIFGSWGLLGVDCFIFISAYFLVDSKRFSSKKLVKIFFQTILYSTVMAFILYASGTVKFVPMDLYKSILAPFFNLYWFVTAYLMLYLIYPFLNKIIHSMDNRYLLKFLIILTILVPVYKTVISEASIGSFLFVIYLYILMGYLKNNPGNWFEKHAKSGFIWTSLAIIFFAVITSVLGTKLDSDTVQNYTDMFIKRFSPAMILDAIFLFYIFKNLKIKSSKFINNVAKTTLGIYLFHENPVLGKVLWDKILKIKTVYHSPMFLVYMFISVVALFVIGAIIDYLRIKLIEEPLFNRKIKCLDFCYSKIDAWMNND
ncbi:MAG TPA: acyltransferase [Mobilitalea sp.]|nr:acyltransferase [Mobilitalea sp.]